MFKRVAKFNEEVLGMKDRDMTLPLKDEHNWLKGVIDEEKKELDIAFRNNNYVGYIDALIDNIYFCLGGLKRIGLDAEIVEEIFEAIHQCNMQKVKGKKQRETMSDDDAIKPFEWRSPEMTIIDILDKRQENANNI